MNIFIWRKNNVSLSRYRDFCVSVKPADFKICDVIISCKLHLCLFVLNPIKIKFGQILVCCMINISNMFLAKCWSWKLVPGSFMILLKWQYSKIWPFLMVDIYHFLIVLYSIPFQKNETLESWHICLSSNWGRLLNWKGTGI